MKALRLATTTSIENSGLLTVLTDAFEKRHGVHVQVTAVGSGRALDVARTGRADVVLVHAPEAEQAFVAEGHGVRRVEVCHNDFVIVGPASDPAGIKGLSVTDALARIASKRTPFVSRGDGSGTHLKEQELWRAARVEAAGDWYVRASRGMGETLRLADEKAACALVDRGTYLSLADEVRLVILCEGDESLRNPYHVIAVSPGKHPDANHEGASTLITWLTSPEGQGLIAGFRHEGHVLFHPSAAPRSSPR